MPQNELLSINYIFKVSVHNDQVYNILVQPYWVNLFQCLHQQCINAGNDMRSYLGVLIDSRLECPSNIQLLERKLVYASHILFPIHKFVPVGVSR